MGYGCADKQGKIEQFKGLVVRVFMGKYVLCDGKPVENCTLEEGDFFIGNIIKIFDSHDEASAMKDVIDAAYAA